MSRRVAVAAIFTLAITTGARAQTSTGTVAGVVTDASGGVIVGAEVTLTSSQTGLERKVLTSGDGRYAATFLSPGTYVVAAQSPALRSQAQSVLVQPGATATMDFELAVDQIVEDATVRSVSRLGQDQQQVGGWIDRAQIASQPLNGRNVFELAKIEPGVTNPARLLGGRVFIAPLGAGLNPIPRVGFTRVTVDGASIETPGTVGSLLQVSPDVVDQVQVSTSNFDMSTGLATSGAVDVVTRAGGNQFHATAFSLYRGRHWSASPVASRDSGASTPSFRRHQAGATIGGPIRTDAAFFFFGYERHEQRDVVAVDLADPRLRPLNGNFVSPYSGTLLNARVDVRLNAAHQAFVRHTHDSNTALTPADGPVSLPSSWSYRPLRAHQTLASLTSVFAAHIINELRVSYYSTRTAIEPVTAADCAAPCFGFGTPRITLSDGGPGVLQLGTGTPGSNTGTRWEIANALAWQKRAHLFRAGFDAEHLGHAVVSPDSDPVLITLWTPSGAAERDPSLDVPETVTSIDDVLALPLRSFTTSLGPSQVLQKGFEPVRRFDLFRAYVSDEWRVRSNVSVNAGLAWSYERGVLNDDLVKPAWLQPLVGENGLHVPASHDNLAGRLGLSWRPTADERTIVRAGVGRYSESVARTVLLNLSNERILLSPLGTNRLVASGANLVWNGRPLNFPQPTTFSGADLVEILPVIRANLAGSLDLDNRDFSIVTLDVTKEGRNLYDPAYSTPRALHASVGVERLIGTGLTVAADVVWKRFARTFINGIDYNRFFSTTGPVIRACTPNERNDVLAECSNGSLFFDTTTGRARYAGLLMRVDKRFQRGARILGSYALGSFVGHNGTGTATSEASDGRVFGFNNDDWSENYGPLPTDWRHVLNVSGLVVAPLDVNVSFNLSAYSRAPFTAYVAGMDFNGDGTLNDLLPGTRVNQFNRGLSRDDLVRLVSDYNAAYAGQVTAGGQRAPFITLPDDFAFNDNFFTLDFRIARDFRLGSSSARLSVFLDVFNVLNTMNLTGFSGNLAASNSFGRPNGRVGQAFGSGGPRAGQLGLRAGF